MTMKPCITCGHLLEDNSRCTDCETTEKRQRPRLTPRISPRANGYDTNWDKLSRQARRLQPWCTDCGSPDDLHADHSTQAWERYYAGKPIRLKDIDVVCRLCNIDRGNQRPGDKGAFHMVGRPSRQAEDPLHTGMVLNKGGEVR